MAQIPYNPVPTVTPSTGAGNDYLNVQANPADAGAQIGAAAQGVGRTLEQGGDMLAQHALALQGMQNETMAAQARNDMASKMADANQAYRSLTGQAAVAAYPAQKAKLQAIYDESLGAMPSPQAKQMFAGAASRYLDFHDGDAANYAGAQNRAWQKQTAVGSIQTAIDQGNLFASDPAKRQLFENTIVADTQNQAELEGWDPATTQAQTAANLGKYYRPMIERMAVTDPSAAAALLKEVAPKMDAASAAVLQQSLKGTTDRAAVASVANQVITAAPAAMTQGSATNSAWARLKVAEGGLDANGNARVSSAGAIGATQLEPDTAKETAARHGVPYDPKLLSTDNSYNEMIGRLHFGDLMQEYGGNVTLAAAAYNAGEGRVNGWLKTIGDPRTGAISEADFAARIPIDETRGYVQRVAQPSATPAATASTHNPDAYASEFAMVQNAWKQAQAKFPDRPDLQRQAVSLVYDHIQQANVLQAKYQAEQAKRQRDAQEQAGQTVIRQLMTDPSHFDPATIRDNPSLTYEQKENLWRLAQSHLAGSGDHDTKTYGDGFYTLYQRVHAPDGDPSKITDPSALWSHVGPNGDLTVSGVDKLTGEIQGRRTADGEAEATMKKQFLANARGQITGTNDGLHIRDPKGDELYLKFLANALPAYDAGRKQGLTPAQLLNPDSKDYIGKSIASFKRPMNEWVRDMLGGNAPGPQGAPPEPGAAPALDLNSRDGIVAAYHTGKISRQQAGAALIAKGFALAPAPAAPPPPGNDVVPH